MLSALSLPLFTTWGCGARSSDDDGGSGGGFSGNMQNLSGTITSQSGTPAQMKSWAVALVERDSRVARVADADAAGILKWNKVSLDVLQTAILLSPDYLMQSVTSLPSTKPNKVRQYFQIGNIVLPQIVQKGAAVSFRTNSGITIADYETVDTDGDGSPDGVGSFGLVRQPLGLVDSDSDGLNNESDSDMDGDGLINSFDGDADGDNVLDVFDSDANANAIADAQETTGSSYFSQGIDYFTVKYEQSPSSNTLLFVLKVRDGLTPTEVKIKGPASLLEGSTAVEGSSGVWDYTLVDDGENGDGAAKDLLYTRKVQLPAGKKPRVNQVVFAQVTYGTGDGAFTLDYPWLFPNLTLSTIATSYNASSRQITLTGDPFGAGVQTFVWSVTLTNSSGLKVYESSALPGTTRTLIIPQNIMQAGGAYSYEAVAQTLDKIPGLPAMAVRSAVGSISN